MKYLHNEPLKKHNSFHIGGNADHFCKPNNLNEIKEAIAFAAQKKVPIAFLGCGTNLLVLDRGFRGLVIKLAPGLSWMRMEGSKAWVGAGTSLPRLIKTLGQKGYGGLEFLAGIPGSIGGAVVMNAGAWKKDLGALVEKVKVIDLKGNEKELNKKQLGFSYRHSKLQKGHWIVIEVLLKLKKSKPKLIAQKTSEILSVRKLHQPLGIPSCGCIFKNPKDDFAGRLIERSGLKGLRVGDAQVSSKHANFIVNLGDAKAKDVLKLMTIIQKKVAKKLVPEIKLLS